MCHRLTPKLFLCVSVHNEGRGATGTILAPAKIKTGL